MRFFLQLFEVNLEFALLFFLGVDHAFEVLDGALGDAKGTSMF